MQKLDKKLRQSSEKPPPTLDPGEHQEHSISHKNESCSEPGIKSEVIPAKQMHQPIEINRNKMETKKTARKRQPKGIEGLKSHQVHSKQAPKKLADPLLRRCWDRATLHILHGKASRSSEPMLNIKHRKAAEQRKADAADAAAAHDGTGAHGENSHCLSVPQQHSRAAGSDDEVAMPAINEHHRSEVAASAAVPVVTGIADVSADNARHRNPFLPAATHYRQHLQVLKQNLCQQLCQVSDGSEKQGGRNALAASIEQLVGKLDASLKTKGYDLPTGASCEESWRNYPRLSLNTSGCHRQCEQGESSQNFEAIDVQWCLSDTFDYEDLHMNASEDMPDEALHCQSMKQDASWLCWFQNGDIPIAACTSPLYADKSTGAISESLNMDPMLGSPSMSSSVPQSSESPTLSLNPRAGHQSVSQSLLQSRDAWDSLHVPDGIDVNNPLDNSINDDFGLVQCDVVEEMSEAFELQKILDKERDDMEECSTEQRAHDFSEIHDPLQDFEQFCALVRMG
jgi:hypothetical protein